MANARQLAQDYINEQVQIGMDKAERESLSELNIFNPSWVRPQSTYLSGGSVHAELQAASEMGAERLSTVAPF